MHHFNGYSPAPAAAGPRSRQQDKEKDKDRMMERERQAAGNAAASASASASAGETGKLNQIVQHYYLKAALVILRSRVDLPPLFTRSTEQKKVDRWFNLEIDDTNAIRESLHTWRTIDLFSSSSASASTSTTRPPPLYLETYLDAADLLPNQSLVILDSRGRRWDALEGLYSEFPHLKPGDKKIVLERWKIHLQQQHPSRLRDPDLEKELAGVLSTLYKKLVLVFRALYSFSRYMPAFAYARKTGKGKRTPITATSASAGLRLRWRVKEGPAPSSTTPAVPPLGDDDLCPNLIAPLYRNSHGRGGAYHHYGYADAGKGAKTADDEVPTTETFDFGSTDSPAGALSISVTYRNNCDFRVDDSEALLSSRFMDDVDVVADETDALFKPTLQTSTARQPRDILSSSSRLPPSLITPRTSVEGRITATAVSARPSTTTPLGQKSRNRERTDSLLTTRRLVEESKTSPNQLRRPSLSFPIFKTPTLSSSPKRVSQLSTATTPSPSNDNLVGAAHAHSHAPAAGAATSRPTSRGSTLFYQHTTTPSSESAKAREIPHHLKRASTTTAATSAGRPQTSSTSLSSRRGTVSRPGSTSNDTGIAPSLHGLAQQYQAAGAGAGAGANSGGIAMNINTGVGMATGPGTGSSPSTSAGSSRPKYSSSFSHRRSRLSLGGMSNPSAAALTDDHNSSNGGPLSRRASLVSIQQGQSPVTSTAGGASAAMNLGAGEGGRYSPSPSSLYQGAAGYANNYNYDMPGFAASLGSMHADEENISDFLKLLESSKDLMKSGFGQSAILGAASPGTTGAAVGGNGGSGGGGNVVSASPNSGEGADALSSSITASQQQFAGTGIGGTTISALSRFHRLKESNQQLSDSMSNSFLLQQQQPQHRPTTASSSSSPRQHLLQLQGSQSYQMSSTTATPPIHAIATSIPMGAMSISPHTPAIPSRLSAASNIDYGDEIGGVAGGAGGAGNTSGGMVVPPPMTAPETEVDISNARNMLVSPVTAATATAAAAAVTAPVTSVGITESAPVDKQESSSDADAASAIATTAGTEMPVATTTAASAAPIDIPSSSPRRYLLSTTNTNRRPVSAAPKPRGRAANADELDDFLPFVKTLSLGNEDVVGRAAPSVGELLRGRSGVRGGPVIPAGAADCEDAHGNGKDDVKSSSSSSPCLAENKCNAGTGVDTVDRTVDVERLPAQPTFSPLDSRTVPTTSAISAATTARRSAFLPHRPSFHRPQPHKGGITRSLGMQGQGSVGSLDEDEPLLFAMSDVGASRRSLESKEREKENRKGGKREAAGVSADDEMAEQMDLEN